LRTGTHSNEQENAMNDGFTMAAVGDVVLTRPFAHRDRADLDPRFRAVLDQLAAADLRFGDLETVLSRNGYPGEKIVVLRADPDRVEDLTAMGFDVFSLANNHSVDFGQDALLETIDVLESNGIRTVGAGKDLDSAVAPVVVERNGARIAFVACTALLPIGSAAAPNRPGLAPMHIHTAFEVNPYYQMEEPGHPPIVRTTPDATDLARIAQQVSTARAEADFVVVSVHMGFGFADELAEYERTLSHALIDAGADIVLGNHVHAIHGIENYRGKAILYSQGNFVAQQPREGEPPEVIALYEQMSDDAYLAVLDVAADGSYGLRLTPVFVNEEGLPVVAEGADFQRIADHVVRLSAQLDTAVAVEGDALVVKLAG
jgi:poly-gamma-glutamate capsule biosynthesis protein CapA/YwtB (metallophosphatase superfamily)